MRVILLNMKTFVISAVALVLFNLTANGQEKKSEAKPADSLKATKIKQLNQKKLDSPGVQGMFGSNFLIRPKVKTNDPFVRKLDFNLLNVQPIELPNGYDKAADRSVAMPTYSRKTDE